VETGPGFDAARQEAHEQNQPLDYFALLPSKNNQNWEDYDFSDFFLILQRKKINLVQNYTFSRDL